MSCRCESRAFDQWEARICFNVTEFRCMQAPDKTVSYITIRAQEVHAVLTVKNKRSSRFVPLKANPESDSLWTLTSAAVTESELMEN